MLMLCFKGHVNVLLFTFRKYYWNMVDLFQLIPPSDQEIPMNDLFSFSVQASAYSYSSHWIGIREYDISGTYV